MEEVWEDSGGLKAGREIDEDRKRSAKQPLAIYVRIAGLV